MNVKYDNGKMYETKFNAKTKRHESTGKEYTGGGYIKGVAKAIDFIKSSDSKAAQVIDKLESSESTHTIGNFGRTKDKGSINLSSDLGTHTKFTPDEDNPEFLPVATLAHELKHAYNTDIKESNKNEMMPNTNNKNFNYEEGDAVNFQNLIHAAKGIAPRTKYGEYDLEKNKILRTPEEYKIRPSENAYKKQ